MSEHSEYASAHGQVEHLNPDDMSKNRAFTQVIAVTDPVKTVYIGGQDAVDGEGNIVGKGDIQKQTVQVLTNVQKALTAAGAGLEHVIKWNIYMVQGQSLPAGFAAFQQIWGNRPNPPTVTMMYVAGLARPEFLVEIDAVAVVPL